MTWTAVHRFTSRRGALALGLAALFVAGCAALPAEEVRARPAGAGVEELEVEAVSFSFLPVRIQASAGSELRLRVRNTSAIDHNLTVLLPDGKVARAVDVGAGKAAESFFRLPRPGRYVIYCDKFLHHTLGMEGVIEVR